MSESWREDSSTRNSKLGTRNGERWAMAKERRRRARRGQHGNSDFKLNWERDDEASEECELRDSCLVTYIREIENPNYLEKLRFGGFVTREDDTDFDSSVFSPNWGLLNFQRHKQKKSAR